MLTLSNKPRNKTHSCYEDDSKVFPDRAFRVFTIEHNAKSGKANTTKWITQSHSFLCWKTSRKQTKQK